MEYLFVYLEKEVPLPLPLLSVDRQRSKEERKLFLRGTPMIFSFPQQSKKHKVVRNEKVNIVSML